MCWFGKFSYVFVFLDIILGGFYGLFEVYSGNLWGSGLGWELFLELSGGFLK